MTKIERHVFLYQVASKIPKIKCFNKTSAYKYNNLNFSCFGVNNLKAHPLIIHLSV